MKVLVIIVTYNAMQWASKCFESLVNSKQQVDVYIIDNGSSDGTQDFIIKNYPQFVFVQSQTNLGFGAANNEGFNYAITHNYDFVYLLNQDAWIYEDTIEKLIRSSKIHKGYGILSPMQYSGNELTLDKGFHHIYHKSLENNVSSNIVDVPFVMAAHWFIPIKVLKDVGAFSPSFFHYGEDLNYIDRIHYHGYKIGIEQSAKCVHDRNDRTVSREKHFYLKKVLNLARLSNPNHSFINNLLISSFYSVAYSLKTLSIKPIKDLVDLLSNISKIISNYKISKYKNSFLH